MMLIYAFSDEASLTATLRGTVAKSLALVKAFPRLTKDDPMVNFPVPEELGVGLARGAATVIRSQGKTLDYTGRTLNLAARLMDLARPRGVVLDDSFGIERLTKTTREKFAKAKVFIPGIAEQQSVPVYFLPDWTEISEYRKMPIVAPVRWPDATETTTGGELKERGASSWIELSKVPARTDDGKIHLTYPKAKADGTMNTTMSWTPRREVDIQQRLGKWYAVIDFVDIAKELEEDNCQDNWPVEVTVEYSVRAI